MSCCLAMECLGNTIHAAALLGHRHLSTTERWYIPTDNLGASRRINQILKEIAD